MVGALPAFSMAERVSPILDLVPTAEPVEEMIRVEDLDPLPPDGFNQMNIAIPDPTEGTTTLKGTVNVDKEFVPDVEFGDGHTIVKGQKLLLVLMDMMATGYSQTGDTFDARVKEAVEQDGKVLIPKGALVRGHIVDIAEAGKAFTKRGKILLGFDYILMPDGRKVPFKSNYTKGDSALKAVGRSVGNGIGGTIGGAILGVIEGLKFGGIATAVSSHGATVIAGGGLGAVAGLGQGLSQRGQNVLLNEGDQIKVALSEPLTLPAMDLPPDTQNEIHASGLNVAITGYTLGRDPFKVENQISLKLKIDNQTAFTFGSFDLAMMDEYNNTFSLSPFTNEGMFVFQIDPKSQFAGEAVFSVKSPDSRHYLVFYKPYTREVIAKISLTEALKNLSGTTAKTKTSSQKGSGKSS
jgi:hypothetical protein